MKVKFKDIPIIEEMEGNPVTAPLYPWMKELKFQCVNPDGSVKAISVKDYEDDDEARFVKHTHHFRLDVVDLPSSQFLALYAHPNVEWKDYPLYLYAPESVLQMEVPEGIHDRTYLDEDDNEVVRTWQEWHEENGTQPVYDAESHNDGTHVIISLNRFGKHLTVDEVTVMIAFANANGFELLGKREVLVRINEEFQTEEP